MQRDVAHDSRRAGAWAVLQAASVMVASVLFLPGVLIRIGLQLLTAAMSSFRVTHRDFVTQLGGEIEISSARGWTRMFVGTVFGPMLLGTALLLPSIIEWALLDVRPFASVSSDPRLIVSRDTSLMPLVQMFAALGISDFLRLWIGVSCFYCCVPSAAILRGASRESRERRQLSPTRLVLGPILAAFNVLRVLDALTVVFAGAYVASGLVVIVVTWKALAIVAQLLL